MKLGGILIIMAVLAGIILLTVSGKIKQFPLWFHLLERKIVQGLQQRMWFFWLTAFLSLGAFVTALLGEQDMNLDCTLKFGRFGLERPDRVLG